MIIIIVFCKVAYKAFLQIDTPILGANRVTCVSSRFSIPSYFVFFSLFFCSVYNEPKYVQAQSHFSFILSFFSFYLTVPAEQPKDLCATATKSAIITLRTFKTITESLIKTVKKEPLYDCAVLYA